MLNDLITHIANSNGLREPIAKQVLGVVLNAAERQASPFADALFKTVPGARALAARTGSDFGAPTGEIARLIEQTPGGRMLVAKGLLSNLHRLGLDHNAIGRLLPTLSQYMADVHGQTGFGHLGDLIGGESAESYAQSARVAA